MSCTLENVFGPELKDSSTFVPWIVPVMWNV